MTVNHERMSVFNVTPESRGACGCMYIHAHPSTKRRDQTSPCYSSLTLQIPSYSFLILIKACQPTARYLQLPSCNHPPAQLHFVVASSAQTR